MEEKPNCDLKLSSLGDRLYSALEELPCTLREQDILNCIEKIERIFRDKGWVEPQQPEWDDHCQKCIRYNDCECEPEELSYCPAEFDRLNEIITNQSSLINNMAERGAKLQAQLDKICEPEEGGLVPNPYRCFCKLVRRMSDAEADEDYASHKFDAGRQAQLAHTMRSLKAQGWVKLPSEDELTLWLCDHLSYTSRGLAQVLLERLLGEKPC